MECVTRFSTSFFWHDLNPSGPLIDRLKYFQILFWFHWNIRSQSLKNSTSWCAWHQGVKILSFFKSFLSWYMYIFTPKRIYPDCPFKNNQRLSKILILTPRCAFLLRGVMPTTELDSTVRCTPRSLTPPWDAHRGAWLCGMMHTAKSDSMVCNVHHTVESDYFKNVRFPVFEFVTSFNNVLSKNVWSKKYSLNNS